MMKYSLSVVIVLLMLGCAGTGPIVDVNGRSGPVWKNMSATLEPGPNWYFVEEKNSIWKFRHLWLGLIGSVIMQPILDDITDDELRQRVESFIGRVISCDEKRIRGQRVFVLRGFKVDHIDSDKVDESYVVCLVSNGPIARYSVIVSTYAPHADAHKEAMDNFVNSFTFK